MENKAYNHGYNCWKEGLLPHSIEAIYLKAVDYNYEKVQLARNNFAKDKQLPSELEQILK